MCELIDFRGKLTKLADDWLDVNAAISGEDKQTIVRNLLHKLALNDIEESTLKYKRLQAKGMVRAAEGN